MAPTSPYLSQLASEDLKSLREGYQRCTVRDWHGSVDTFLSRLLDRAIGEAGSFPLFQEYLDREVHYALERRGYRWNSTEEQFEGLSPDGYREGRSRLLKEFVLHGYDTFQHGKLELLISLQGRVD